MGLSIAYVLQKPVRRQLAPEAFAARRLVGRCGDREKLSSLDIAALRVGDLAARGAAAHLAARHVGEADVPAPARQRAPAHRVRAPAGILRARDVSQVL